MSTNGKHDPFDHAGEAGAYYTPVHDTVTMPAPGLFPKIEYYYSVGPKGLAIIAYQKRKTEIREGKFLPEKVNEHRQAVFFEDMLTMYLDEYSKANKRSYKTDLAKAVRLRRELSGKTLQEVTTQDVERLKANYGRK